ncbi:hypothetical protein ACFX15_034295 [Malus domestica]|uniref:agamous-like MADS-box protein AGL62 n=1 Tax=Malus domestica TaxID=3750 RepID=UPI0039757A35
MAKKSKGRQKVEMVKMANESNLQVTFSKRRSGLFKKASELCTLCGAEVGIIVFSPGRRVFSFGHPSVEAVMDRFLSRNPFNPHLHPPSGTMQLIEAHRNATVRELNTDLTQVMNQLEAEKKRRDQLNQMTRVSQAQCWWEAPMDEMQMPQLDQLKSSLVDLKMNMTKQADRVLIQNTLNPNSQFFVGSSSQQPVMRPHNLPHPNAWNHPGHGRFF